MIFDKPIPFAEALQSRTVKSLMPTAASAAEIAALDSAIRERAMFSARVEDANFLAKADRLINGIVSPTSSPGAREGRKTPFNEAEARGVLKEYLASIGYQPDKEGGLQDLGSDVRLNLIIRMNNDMAAGAGQFAVQNDPDILDAYPCLELYRLESREKPRDWISRWRSAGGQIYGGRMIARKDERIWTEISEFGTPYPPFDYNSGMWTREISRREAEEFGVIKRSTVVAPQKLSFNDNVKAALPTGNPDLVAEVIKAFDGKVLGAGGWLRFVSGLDDAALTAVKTEQAATGAELMQTVINDRADVMNAMTRTDLSGPIDFRFGNEKLGIDHIITQREYASPGSGEKMAMRIPEVIAHGEIDRQSEHKVTLALDGDRVVMTDDFNGKAVNRWVLTAFEKKEAR
jgi:hypothetical protein